MKPWTAVAVAVVWTTTGCFAWATADEPVHSVGAEVKPVSAVKAQLAKKPRSVEAGLAPLPVSVRLPEIDLSALAAEDAQANPREKGVRIGAFRDLPAPATVAPAKSSSGGAWTALPDGGHVWRFAIESPGAIGIRVQISDLYLPEGVEIVAYAGDDPAQIRGPYAARELAGRDRFWTGTIFADGVAVEFHCPPDVAPDQVRFEIERIIHIYRDPVAPTKVGNCHNDVTCYPAWTAVGNGVAGIGTVGDTGFLWCTGCLLNDQDPGSFIDYFMTANHCVASQSEADDTEFYWFYKTGTCNGAPPSLGSATRTGGGAAYLAGRTVDAANDFAFLRLRTAAPGGVTYAGWSTATPGGTETLTGIHHPDGSYKRISFARLVSSDANFWDVRWFDGVTEPGSSGSPLFNDRKEFIGQLYGGYSACNAPSELDYYGRFNASYPHISKWLASSALGVSPASRLHPAAGAAGQTFAVTAGGAWTAVSDQAWLAITAGAAGSGNGPVTYTAAANAGGARSGTITVSGGANSRTFTVDQWAAATHPRVSAEGDFDGDFATDVATFRPATGSWVLQLSRGTEWTVPFGSKTMLPVPADYDGDGLVDFALFQRATGDWYFQYSSGGSRVIRFGWTKTVPLPGDYDGDGKADLALFYPDLARWYFLCSTAGGYSRTFGSKTDIPVPADYDGDGKTDVAVYRPSNGNWYILNSGGGSRVRQLGWAGTIPVPGDYDGDGQADLAVLSRASSKWCINYSGGGSLILPFGWKTMIPVQADYDGDGATDVAMYHSASGTWFIRQSTSLGVRKEILGGPDRIPVLLYPQIYSWFGLL